MSKGFVSTVAAIMMLGMLAGSIAEAQDGPRRGGRGPGGPGGPGGFGGFGGAMQGEMLQLALLRVEEVREHLDVMPDQAQAIRTLQADLREGARPDFGSFREASEEQRRELAAQMQTQAQERAKKIRETLDEVLLPEQNERLQQIALQQQGVAALTTNPEVREKLSITEEQVNQIREKQRERMQEAFRGAGRGGDREALAQRMQEVRQEAEKEALEVLTSEQREQFQELQGEPFDLPEGALQGAGRGPGPGGAGRGGRGGPGGGARGAGGRRGGGDGPRGGGRRGGDRT